ncbi:PP2C family protein-serine/threonine phosphatase [Phytohabitans houttuyneae]|uniref:PP2C family protein-serine/threonine phosphatase n=1 Tax=Phytohabitans houttuyneae TaxID=1076126 RepID=UPI001FE94D14|nr:GAF domain-containing SpoIIE family protein phosphatase [Phytohabitans houttuyneae]
MVEALGGGSDERLRRIEALTDTSLSQLDPDDMINELLDRVRGVLGTDTAVLLLLDTHAQQLVATASKGLEQRLWEGVRVSVGRGFAGRIAVEKRALALDDVGPGDLASPLLLEAGIRALLGVPMFAAGELIGVLHVGSRTPRRFTDDDMRLLKLAADRASAAAQAQARGIDRTAALALQRSLLPTRLPEVPGVEIAARYVPGHDAGVGGDWYDVFTLPSGWLGVVIGDVSGHGLRSAVVMGRLRSALRAYSLVCDDPADALTLLDRKVYHFEAGNLATVMYAMVSPDATTVQVSLAGHFHPVLAVPGRPAVFAEARVDLPLGLGGRHGKRHRTELPLPPGSVLVCYTDGLIERRDEVIDVGLERLRASVTPGPAEQVCAAVMAAVAEERPGDDIAMLAIRRT